MVEVKFCGITIEVLESGALKEGEVVVIGDKAILIGWTDGGRIFHDCVQLAWNLYQGDDEPTSPGHDCAGCGSCSGKPPEECDEKCGCEEKPAKETNDGLERCRWCGGGLRRVEGLMSWYDVCVECGR